MGLALDAGPVTSDEERAQLQRWRRRRSGSSGLYVRAGIVLDCAAGLSGAEIADRHRTSQQTVTKWRRRFAGGGLTGLLMRPEAASRAGTATSGCRRFWTPR